MSGLSYNIDKLLRDIEGGGLHQHTSLELHSVSSASDPAATSFGNSYLRPHMSRSRHPTNVQGQYPIRGRSPDIEDYGSPLDAFDHALLAEPAEATHRFSGADNKPEQIQQHQRRSYISNNPYDQVLRRETQNRPNPSKYIVQALFLIIAHIGQGQPFQTPPSQLLAEPSSPSYPPASSPLAEVLQRRATQAFHPSDYASPNDRTSPTFPSHRNSAAGKRSSAVNLGHAPPIVQGIQLVSPNELSDRFRSVFPFPLFNAVQSKCYSIAYRTSDNLVVSAPTGSGKTVILELSICQLLSGFQTDQFKIVYMAPTKSLCAERHKDWQTKFAALGLQCAELTGDTDQGQLRNVQTAGIIITTPEKWDSMTRKWKDHAKLMELVKLFLIDEVHILKETRGACLEAVVSRMKSVGSNVRFLALSATVPNSEDIAVWLRQGPTAQHLPAHRERFGEEFRPVKLQKHVVGLHFNGNDWGFDRACDPKLPEIVTKYSQKKPIMVFCITRKSTVSTAKLLADWWASKGARERQWAGPTFRLVAQDSDLKVGVNLPCHMVIIKNTMCFQEEGLKEYSDLEIMQMLGRAGRPQFEDSAVAVIITKQDKVQKYEKMVSGQELLESSLHLNLIEHLNAETGLGTIHNLHTAKRWLAGTFLYVRLGHNPAHYKLDGDATKLNLDDRIERICQRDIDLLLEAQLVTWAGDRIKCTEFGDAMARYYVKFETMKGLLSLEPRSKMSDILSVLVGAEEFRDVRFRAGEKKLLKDINGANGIKYPIKVDLALSQHKRSLIIQSELGGVEFPVDEQYGKFQRQYQQDKNIIFNHIHRLIRCVIDCQIFLQDAVTVRHALELARSFAARVWDNSPYQLKQVPNIGPAAVRRLASGGINSIESLEASEPHKIEMLMSKHPPFGSKILASLRDFPKLRDVKRGKPVKIKIRAELGFMNEKPPAFFHRKAVHVCFLAERSDGELIDFRRISAMKLNNGQDVLISADLLQHTQYITCYVMCDEIAGTLRYAELKPDLPPSIFSTLPLSERQDQRPPRLLPANKDVNATSPSTVQGDEGLYGDGIADEDMFEADFNDIAAFEEAAGTEDARKKARRMPGKAGNEAHDQEWAPIQLENGKWACNHKCKDKTACKHLCCHEGVDKPPKPPKRPLTAANAPNEPRPKSDAKSVQRGSSSQMKLPLGKPAPAKEARKIETVDLAHGRDKDDYAKVAPRAYRSLHQLHDKVNKTGSVTPVMSNTKPSFSYKKGDLPRLTFLGQSATPSKQDPDRSSDYGAGWMDDLPSPARLLHADNEPDGASKQTITNRDDILSLPPVSDHRHFEFDFTGDSGEEQQSETSIVDATDTAIFDDSGYKEAMETLEAVKKQDVSQYFAPGPSSRVEKETSSQKLFMSTDSPEKPSSPNLKRDISQTQDGEVNEANIVPEAKRKRLDETTDAQTLHSPPIEEGVPSSVATIKAGYPDWVYEFDPAFVAEWEPYVEFRKTEGVKLGQSIAKDMSKRIPPGTGSKAALRDPIVELDITGKALGEDGFLEVAAALVKALEYDGQQGRVLLLEELCLKNNNLNAACLLPLAKILRLAAFDIRDLDLSNNDFAIANNRDADAWQDFLESVGGCCLLRRMDLSGNKLGPKAFEVLAKVYSQEPPIEGCFEDDVEITSHEGTSGRRSISLDSDALSRQTRNLSLGSAAEALTDDDDVSSVTGHRTAHGTRHDLTDAGALHLSYIVSSHHHPGRLIPYVPPARSSLHIQQLEYYNSKTGCQGIIYLPNLAIGTPGFKVLELSEGARFSLLDDDRPTPLPEAMQLQSRNISTPRKTSLTHSSPSTAAAGARRRSGTKGEHDDFTDGEAVSAELDRARSRIQGNVLRDDGVQSHDLWRTALGMLNLCRMLCPLRKEEQSRSQTPIVHEVKVSTAQQFDTPEFPALPKQHGKPFVGYLDPFAPPLAQKSPNMPITPSVKSKKHPLRLKTATPSPLSMATSPTSPGSPGTSALQAKSYRSDLPAGLPGEAWSRIMGLYVQADRFMTRNQQRNVLRWATDRRTLGKELESLGKPESAQIWKVLDGMGCLAYEGDG
ncbi:MAG: hypothetical protein LQ346_003530 [Caloplaca aetnensis]|nr:MAG: hypothetical protein LQ346_003530 [Caloplaca aetnensis]